MNGTSFDLDDTIVSACLQDLSKERRLPKDAADHLLVEIESVGDDQWKTLEGHPVGDVAHEGERVPVASSYMHEGRQYIVVQIAKGGEFPPVRLAALALPE